jgi:hypothetical protein
MFLITSLTSQFTSIKESIATSQLELSSSVSSNNEQALVVELWFKFKQCKLILEWKCENSGILSL